MKIKMSHSKVYTKCRCGG